MRASSEKVLSRFRNHVWIRLQLSSLACQMCTSYRTFIVNVIICTWRETLIKSHVEAFLFEQAFRSIAVVSNALL